MVLNRYHLGLVFGMNALVLDLYYYLISKTANADMPFALHISAVPEEAPGCAAPHLTLGEGPAWSWHRAYRDVFTQHLNSIVHWLWLTILDNSSST
ncbi:protein of unknown function [Methylotuvimicrobium alcaliphilum 20Z]|uniref:Uncharacterized protein n=1 Tax=Methylotuvimicrobium alcaliphilum (strain DSM 19304 / NCIMB 14124 / VKM B-2133 / 20Z) TaxID=1091494 RepID=G4T1H6_META2|nr:protein of unknown function [Methylotuvimicrobium alcaliphilum 20Z]